MLAALAVAGIGLYAGIAIMGAEREPQAVILLLKESISFQEIQQVLHEVVGQGDSGALREGVQSVEAGGYTGGQALLTVRFDPVFSEDTRSRLIAEFRASPLIDSIVPEERRDSS